MSIFVYPGQGAQRRGMGMGLFDEVEEFRSVEGKVDAHLGYSVRQLCLEDRENRLKDTEFTQPALFVVNALHHYRATRNTRGPELVAGHSLGEYNALMAAGVFDLYTGVQLVKKRGELMARARGGGMIAVVGMSRERISDTLTRYALDDLDIANDNSPIQVVVSGPKPTLTKAEEVFRSAGARFIFPLQVSAPFHSRYMHAAAREFAEFLVPFEFAPPQLPVIANVTGHPYPDSASSSTIKEMLARQIVSPVLWRQSVRHFSKYGIRKVVEIGPTPVLMKLVEQCSAESVELAS